MCEVVLLSDEIQMDAIVRVNKAVMMIEEAEK